MDMLEADTQEDLVKFISEHVYVDDVTISEKYGTEIDEIMSTYREE